MQHCLDDFEWSQHFQTERFESVETLVDPFHYPICLSTIVYLVQDT